MNLGDYSLVLKAGFKLMFHMSFCYYSKLINKFIFVDLWISVNLYVMCKFDMCNYPADIQSKFIF